MHRRQPTRNRMGWTSNQLNTLSQLFVDACRPGALPVLDLGAAYGVASLAALARGAKVIANDLDAAHLAELGEREGLTLLPGRFPQELDLPANSLSAVHASNVLHFLTGEELTLGAAKIAEWLGPGGRLYVHAGTPYQAPFARFIPEYEKRAAAGELWPGYVPDTRAISSHRKLGQIPRAIHLLDAQVLTRVFLAAGFEIERVWTHRRHDLPKSLHCDGREGVALIAHRS
ncbi:MAG: class I SAM-dependent methyltransferase [Bryobacteraceae bacterium]|nr:class I SAM-dependent methyltransferase [Bryobacteraceae bacterium]